MPGYAQLSDQELAALLREGDSDALKTLYDRHIRQLHYFILRTAKSRVLAEDVVHDVFIKLWENHLSIDPAQPFKPYLYTIARRHLLNLLKRAQHEASILAEILENTSPVENTTDQQLDFNESNGLFSEAINQLPAHCREVFVRCKIQGQTYKQAAEELGITEGTVNSQMVKALRSIKRFITIRNAAISLALLYLLN